MTSPAAIGLVGKLPAHGDFVRRGGPPALLARIDGWLDAELSRAALSSGADFAGLDGWRFAIRDEAGLTLGTMLASRDAVDRGFPLVGTIGIAGPVGFAACDRWCDAAGEALARARDGGGTAATAMTALSALPAPAGGDDMAAGWWRVGDVAVALDGGLPTGAAFGRLLAAAA